MKYQLLAICVCITFGIFAQQPLNYKVDRIYHIASAGGWDYIAADEGKLYVSHAMQVNILNEETGDSLGVLPNTAGVHGIAFDHALNHGFTSNGRANNVTVFDLKTYKPITQIATGQNPDAILYDPATKKIVTCNGRGKSLTVIDPASNNVVSTIDVGGKPEAAVSDGAGNLYVNIEDKNEIVLVNLKQKAVVRRFDLRPGESPTGLAFDKKTKRLFAGCDDMLVVVNAEMGTVVDTIAIGSGCDGVAFDEGKSLIYTSNGQGTLSVIREKSANEFVSQGDFPTKKSARTIALDEKKGEIFLPAADFRPAPTTSGRPQMIPGSFQVLVVKEAK